MAVCDYVGNLQNNSVDNTFDEKIYFARVSLHLPPCEDGVVYDITYHCSIVMDKATRGSTFTSP